MQTVFFNQIPEGGMPPEYIGALLFSESVGWSSFSSFIPGLKNMKGITLLKDNLLIVIEKPISLKTCLYIPSYINR